MSCFCTKLAELLSPLKQVTKENVLVSSVVSQLIQDGFTLKEGSLVAPTPGLTQMEFSHDLISPQVVQIKCLLVADTLNVYVTLVNPDTKAENLVNQISLKYSLLDENAEKLLTHIKDRSITLDETRKLFGDEPLPVLRKILVIRRQIWTGISEKVIPLYSDYINTILQDIKAKQPYSPTKAPQDSSTAPCEFCAGRVVDETPHSSSSSSQPRHPPPNEQLFIHPPQPPLGKPEAIDDFATGQRPPRFGDSDRNPPNPFQGGGREGRVELGGGGGGGGGSGRGSASGGNLLGPNHPLFGGGVIDIDSYTPDCTADDHAPPYNSVPPGARFDPPAPGIYPQAPGRGRGNVGGVNNPDLEFFRGPGGGGSNDFI